VLLPGMPYSIATRSYRRHRLADCRCCLFGVLFLFFPFFVAHLAAAYAGVHAGALRSLPLVLLSE
jgi:hypothetical protein